LINYPNPFNATTHFFIHTPELLQENSGEVSLYNAAGQLVKTILFKGSANIRWDARDEQGNLMPTGVYYYRLAMDHKVMKSGAMLLVK
jgi:flagellar hook assembly protein FlgD